MEEAFIVSAVRTPIGKFLGALKGFPATELGAMVVKEAVARAGAEPERIEEVILGNVISAGLGQNPARQAALGAGLPPSVGALTINKVCGSGLKAVMLARQAIACGDGRVIVAGGMESMSNGPYLAPGVREGLRLGPGQLLDATVHDGLWDVYNDFHMGMTGERVSEKYGIDRRQMDEYALQSHRKAARAIREGKFKAETLPVLIPQKKGEPLIFDTDESVREDSSLAALEKLKPVFKTDGTVTAGNAPGMNDGAAALLVASGETVRQLDLEPMARIVGQAISGLEPEWVLMTPVPAIQKLMEKIGWKMEDVDLFEINEAFAVQACAVSRELKLDPAKLNVHGGAVALGHPIGASGARVLTTLVYALRDRKARRGVAALCLGGGNGVALAVERV
ncbi:MAG TPA: acetyl-CoA C-acetyltransferase [Vicinamibacteria bacterium]|nr:acetyl-CoA C-acetyltransferase [Vicinamibacteria bacterium]